MVGGRGSMGRAVGTAINTIELNSRMRLRVVYAECRTDAGLGSTSGCLKIC